MKMMIRFGATLALVALTMTMAHADESWTSSDLASFLKGELRVTDHVSLTKLEKRFNWGNPGTKYDVEFVFSTSEDGTEGETGKPVTIVNTYRGHCKLTQQPDPGRPDLMELSKCGYDIWIENTNPRYSRWRPVDNVVMLRDLYYVWENHHSLEILTGGLPGEAIMGGSLDFGVWNVKHAQVEDESAQKSVGGESGQPAVAPAQAPGQRSTI